MRHFSDPFPDPPRFRIRLSVVLVVGAGETLAGEVAVHQPVGVVGEDVGTDAPVVFGPHVAQETHVVHGVGGVGVVVVVFVLEDARAVVHGYFGGGVR